MSRGGAEALRSSRKFIDEEPQWMHLYFRIQAPFTIWDQEALEALSENRTSVLYDEVEPEVSALFKDATSGKCTLLFDTFIELYADTEGAMRVRACPWNRFQSVVSPVEGEHKGRIPHPHLARYNCFGDLGTMLTTAIAHNDYAGVIDIQRTACAGMNMHI